MLVHIIVPAYELFNCILASIVVIVSMILMGFLSKVSLKDGFRYSLYTIFVGASIIELAIAILSPQEFENNWAILVISLLFIIEIILLVSTNHMSNKFLTNK